VAGRRRSGDLRPVLGAPGKGGSGKVYIDMNDPTTETVRVFKTTSIEDQFIVEYMKSRIGDTAPYNALTNSCRDFSAAEFDKIRDELVRARAEKRRPKL
jgi:ribosomal protein RSM22 (predicted rRNA methylase)